MCDIGAQALDEGSFEGENLPKGEQGQDTDVGYGFEAGDT